MAICDSESPKALKMNNQTEKAPEDEWNKYREKSSNAYDEKWQKMVALL